MTEISRRQRIDTGSRADASPRAGRRAAPGARPVLRKAPTGIQGLDEITGGGLPQGRPTLVCGAAGCGKTLLGMEFLVHGAERFGEPGVFVSFEERVNDLEDNVASLGFDLPALQAAKQLVLDHVRVERSEIEECGEYDLEGLFVRLGHAIDSVGARRVVLDTIESLFGGLGNENILRAEIRRLFGWLKSRGVTAVVTGERGDGQLTRHGLEEYVSDCVILLDHRVDARVSTRRLRVVKYRGSNHGTDEYPFLIGDDGLVVMPVSSLRLDHPASTRRVPTGVPALDEMLGGKGYYAGSSILVTGMAGSGKTSVAGHFAAAACARGERCLYFVLEESPQQLMRNMRSVGIDLETPAKQGLLRFHAARPTYYGLETHLAAMHADVQRFAPSAVVIDPITPLLHIGSRDDVNRMLLRLVDSLKSARITALFTGLTHDDEEPQSGVDVSSLMDTWLLLRNIESDGERNRLLYVLKARGMAHSNQVREFLLTDGGVVLREVYVGTGGVLTGSARLAQEAREREAALAGRTEIERRRRDLERRRAAAEVQMATLRASVEADAEDLRALEALDAARRTREDADRRRMTASRYAGAGNGRTRVPAGRGKGT
jgi:circadian clock protein KaiC